MNGFFDYCSAVLLLLLALFMLAAVGTYLRLDRLRFRARELRAVMEESSPVCLDDRDAYNATAARYNALLSRRITGKLGALLRFSPLPEQR